MALSGVHVACLFVGGAGQGQQIQSLAKPPAWSQTMASAGITTQGAPNYDGGSGQPCFEIRSSADVYVAIGATPDATNGPRIFVPANETRNIFCASGDKLAWVAA